MISDALVQNRITGGVRLERSSGCGSWDQKRSIERPSDIDVLYLFPHPLSHGVDLVCMVRFASFTLKIAENAKWPRQKA